MARLFNANANTQGDDPRYATSDNPVQAAWNACHEAKAQELLLAGFGSPVHCRQEASRLDVHHAFVHQVGRCALGDTLCDVPTVRAPLHHAPALRSTDVLDLLSRSAVRPLAHHNARVPEVLREP